MKDKDLCKWLRENSSGSYRKSAQAADRIEQLIDYIKAAGERNNECTQGILNETCKDCRCAI